MKKIVLKLDLHDDKQKQKAMKTVSALEGIDSIAMDMKEKKMTVIGSADPVEVVSKLRKFWPTSIISVGPAKEEAKKGETKKEEVKKEATKKDQADKKDEKKEEAGKKEEKKKDETKKKEMEEGARKEPHEQQMMPELVNVNAYRAYNPHMTTHYYLQSEEENPNSCTIL